MIRGNSLSVVCVFIITFVVFGQGPGPTGVPGGITYEPIARWDTARLDAITGKELAAFTKTDVAFEKAKYAVKLYRVVYPSVVPERGNHPTMASGLVAIPETGTAAMPMVSYQHGTVYGRTEVPSVPDDSMETRLALARFAAQGYIVIGADYFGLGSSPEKDGYIVKESQQQACLDMYLAALSVLKTMNVTPKEFFLSGWSQGGWVTAALLEKFEALRIPVTAAATACAPSDFYAGLTAIMFHPRPEDAPWKTTMVVLSAFAYEHYYRVDGMAAALFRPEVYDVVKRFYMKEPVDISKMPTELDALLRKEWLDPIAFAGSPYVRLLTQNHTFRLPIRTPTRTYYGELDEIVRPDLARLGAHFNRAFGAETVEAVSTGQTNHRGTYMEALKRQKPWFDSFLKP